MVGKIKSSINNISEFKVEDPLLEQRECDLKNIEPFLKSHDLYGHFFTKYWDKIKGYLRLEEFHPNVTILNYYYYSRKIYLSKSGEVAAYVVGKDSPKYIGIHKYQSGDLISDLGALFSTPWHYGLETVSNCELIALDLQYVEEQETSPELFMELMDLIYPETARICTDLYNTMLEKKLDLETLLGKYNFFADIRELDKEYLHNLADKMRYVYLPDDKRIIDDYNREYLYILESGSVKQRKIYFEIEPVGSYIDYGFVQAVENKTKLEDFDYSLNAQLQEVNIKQELNNTKNSVELSNSASKYAFDQMLKTQQSYYSDNINYWSSHQNYKDHNVYSRNIDARFDQNYTKIMKMTIDEDVYRYGTVGEENLTDFDTIEVTAVTEAPCCLLEIPIDVLIKKDSIFAQIVGFFNNKINHTENVVIEKQKTLIEEKNNYISYLNFSFIVMMMMSLIGILGRFHFYLDLHPDYALLYHTATLAIPSFILAYYVSNLHYGFKEFGLTRTNFNHGFILAIFASIVMILLATGFKELFILYDIYTSGRLVTNYNLFEPDLVVNASLTLTAYWMYIVIYIIYLFIYELAVRGVIQNIFSRIIQGSYLLNYWGSILAASMVGSQFHMSLFHEFSLSLFMGNITAGILFAKTRNLWVVIIFHSIFSLYLLTVLGLIPGSHFD